jgi:glycopeptide antibiotics resistance protein/GNAT superfamily N-acetyltransferase
MIYFDDTHFFAGLAPLTVFLVILWRRKHSLSYLFLFSVFWIYLLAVAAMVFFPFTYGSNIAPFQPSINLIPFSSGGCYVPEVCWGFMRDNVLLTIPFGFGICFLTRIKPKTILWLAPAAGIVLESTQLLVSLIFKSSFRVTDIDDVILNGVGVVLGYAAFRLFAWLYLAGTRLFNIRHWGIFADIYSVALLAQPSAAEFAIRPFHPEYQESVKKLILTGLSEHWGWLDASKNPDLDDISAAYANAIFLTGWRKDRLVATGALVPRSSDTAEIVRMSVATGLRRQGIGKRMLCALCEYARSSGYRRLILETTATWTEVIAFYQRFGFRITHHQDGDAYFALDL